MSSSKDFIQALEAEEAEIEARMNADVKRLTEIRELLPNVRRFAGLDAAPAKSAPAEKASAKPGPKAKSKGGTRSFTCDTCNKTKDAPPRGRLPVTCKACKAEAKEAEKKG